MKASIIFGAAIAAVALVPSALAEEQNDKVKKSEKSWYGELGVSNVSVDFDVPVVVTTGFSRFETTANFNESLFGVHFRGGYNFNKYFALEADGTLTFNSKEVIPEYDMRPSGIAGVYMRANLPLGEKFKVFGRVGYSQVSYLFESDNFDIEDDEFVSDQHQGPAFGGGAQFDVTDTVAIRGDYTSFQVDGSDVSSASLGAVFTF